MHTEAHLFSVPNDCLWYDKLWGPSQRVVTLFPYKLICFSGSSEHLYEDQNSLVLYEADEMNIEISTNLSQYLHQSEYQTVNS